jgi:hypothetical protein
LRILPWLRFQVPPYIRGLPASYNLACQQILGNEGQAFEILLKISVDSLPRLNQALVMVDIKPEQFTAYCRNMAKKHSEIAKRYEEMATFNDAHSKPEPVTRYPRVPVADVTLEQFLEAVRRKNGRRHDFAVRLNTDDDTIERLITEAGDQVQRVERGWLKPA